MYLIYLKRRRVWQEHQLVKILSNVEVHIKKSCVVDSCRSVSYTHLDVYKRQLPSSVKIECDNVRWNTLVTTVLWFCLLYTSGNFFSMANDISRNFKQNQIFFCMHPWIVENRRSIDFGEDRLRERGSLPATVFF